MHTRNLVSSSLSSLDVHQLDFLRMHSQDKNSHLHQRYFHCEPHRHSPSLDQGYATLLSSPVQSALSNRVMNANTNKLINNMTLVHKVANLSISSSSLCSLTKVGKYPTPISTTTMMNTTSKGQMFFDSLPNEVIVKIFQWIDTYDLLLLATVCRRFEKLIWNPLLWKKISLKGEQINGDKALNSILRRLCDQTQNNCSVERVMMSEGCKLTDKGLQLLIRRCPNITHLQTQFSTTLTNQSLFDFVSKCTNLQHLDITGCPQISCISLNAGIETPRKLLLQYLDLTDCASVDDCGLKTIVKNCPLLIFLYMRRCIQITDTGLKYLPKFCIALKELSVSDCINVTDFGLYELSKLGQTLRYLSVAKCDQVSDVGLKYLSRRCYKLRYLNVRGCEAISDDSIIILARSCPRLRALDIGKCDVSDAGLFALSESCPNLKKLSLKSCDIVTDEGIKYISYYCRGLQQLNIQDCQITIEGYRAVKRYCKRCIIEHSNLNFS